MNSIRAHEKDSRLCSSEFSLHSSFTVAGGGEGTLSEVQQKWHFHFRRRNAAVFTVPGTNDLQSGCAVQSEIGSRCRMWDRKSIGLLLLVSIRRCCDDGISDVWRL